MRKETIPIGIKCHLNWMYVLFQCSIDFYSELFYFENMVHLPKR